MAFARRSIRAVRLLARDGRIPRPLRGAAALLFAFYRGPLREAWRAAA